MTAPNAPGAQNLESTPRTGAMIQRVLECVLFVVGAWAYLPTLASIVSTWASNPDYSHGYLVVPVALAFLWVRSGDRPTAAGSFRWEGLGLIAVAAVLRYSAGRFYLPELDGWSIPFWLGGTVFLFHGRNWFRWAVPSLGFLWFATPLPAGVEILLSAQLQQLAATLGSWTLRLVGQPALAEGTTILLNEHVLDIERACSGLRMFYGILAMAVASVVFSRVRGWTACWILLATAPIAISANVFRITLTGLLLQAYSSKAASTFSHDVAGYLMIPVAMLLFALFSAWLFSTADRLRQDRVRGVAWISRWAVAVLVVIGGLVGWGRYQQRHMLSALLEKSGQYAAEGKWDWAVVYLERYIQTEPEDLAVLERYADVYARKAASRRERWRSLNLAERVWKRTPARTDLAEYAARTAHEIGEFQKAADICELLLKAKVDGPTSDRVKLTYADSLLQLFRADDTTNDYSWEDLANALAGTRSIDTDNLEYEIELARVWQEKLRTPDRKTREAFARELMDTLVSEHSEDPMSWLARYQFQIDFGVTDEETQRDQSYQDLNRALQLLAGTTKANQTKIYLAAALDPHFEGKAERFLELAIDATPKNPRPYVLLSERKRRSGKPKAKQEALQILTEALKSDGGEQVDLLLPLAALQVELKDYEGAKRSIERVEQQIAKFPDRVSSKLRLGAGILRTQTLQHEEGPYPAIRNLEPLISDDEVGIHRHLSPQLFARAHVLLGRLYTSVGILDRASEQYRAALQLNPTSIAIRTEALAPVLNSGDLESTELLCRQLLREIPDSETALTAMVRVHVRRQLRLPLASRDWSLAERAFQRAVDAGVPYEKLLVTEVELLESRGKTKEAKQKLAAALRDSPDQSFLWRESALLHDRLGEADSAVDSASEYAKLRPAELEPLVLKATLLEKANRSDEALLLLQSLLKSSSGSRWLMAAQELARLQLLLGHLGEAQLLLQEIQEKEPANLVSLNALATLAWAIGDWAALKNYETLLIEQEGETGTLWRFHRSQRLLEQATSTLDPAFEAVSRLTDDLQELRPRWSKTSLLLGNIALRSGKVDAAIAAYQRAWELGDRGALLADRLIELLNEQGRESEAQSYVLQVQNSLSLSSRLFDRAMPYYVQQQQEASLRLAKAWVARRPNDADAHLRLGRVHVALSLLGERNTDDHLAEAAQSLMTALKLNPNDVGIWLANVACARRLQGVQLSLSDFIDGLKSHVEFDSLSQALVLADVYEELGAPRLARSQYHEAARLALGQDDTRRKADTLARLANFYFVIEPILAEHYAQQALALDNESILAQQVMLQIFAESNSPTQIEDAIALASTPSRFEAGEDADLRRRLQAKLLIMQGAPAGLRQASELLETLLQQTRADQRLLASAYEHANRIGPAFEIYNRLASSRSAAPEDYVAFLEFWQKHFVAKAAERSEPKFASIANAVYLRLKRSPSQQAEWLRLKIQEQRIANPDYEVLWKGVQPFVNELEKENRELDEWSSTARVAWCRSLLQMLCRAGYENCSYSFVDKPPTTVSQANAAIALSHALILTPVAREKFGRAPDYLSERRAANPGRADLALAVGDLLFMSGRYAAAVETYQETLNIEPRNKLAKNNLALALAELPGRLDDAKLALEEALLDQSDDPILLDTKAVLELIDDRPQQAIETLNRVLAVSPDNTPALIHASMAYQLLGNEQQAKELYLDALSVGLNESLLSPRARAYCRDISEQVQAEYSDGKNLTAQRLSRRTN